MKSNLDRIMENPDFRAELLLQGLYIEMAESIQAIRMSRGLNQVDLAKLIGTTQSGVSRFENLSQCSFTLRSLAGFADALNCELKVSLVPKDG